MAGTTACLQADICSCLGSFISDADRCVTLHWFGPSRVVRPIRTEAFLRTIRCQYCQYLVSGFQFSWFVVYHYNSEAIVWESDVRNASRFPEGLPHCRRTQ